MLNLCNIPHIIQWSFLKWALCILLTEHLNWKNVVEGLWANCMLPPLNLTGVWSIIQKFVIAYFKVNQAVRRWQPSTRPKSFTFFCFSLDPKIPSNLLKSSHSSFTQSINVKYAAANLDVMFRLGCCLWLSVTGWMTNHFCQGYFHAKLFLYCVITYYISWYYLFNVCFIFSICIHEFHSYPLFYFFVNWQFNKTN